jgi:hypothetical protein
MGKTKRLITAAPIHYHDRYNYIEVAATILGHLEEALGDEELLGAALTGEGVNVEEFGAALEHLFDNHATQELVNTQFGRGILFGMYLQLKSEAMVTDEQEVLDEMDV